MYYLVGLIAVVRSIIILWYRLNISPKLIFFLISKSLQQITPDKQKLNEQQNEKSEVVRSESEENPVESFFDLLSRCQSERMDDQRATLNANKENRPKLKPNINKLQRSASSGNKHTR